MPVLKNIKINKSMKGKIKKIFNWLFKIGIKVAEFGTVIWAINGMLSKYRFCRGVLSPSCDYPISPILAYFLSAILILYLLRNLSKR